MASVWKHFKSANWFARYRGTGGKTVNRSTGVTEKEEARRIAAQWEIEAAREVKKGGGEVSPGGISDAIARAERLARLGRLDSAAAREVVNDLLAAAGQDSVDAIVNRAWCDGWKASKVGAVKLRSQLKYSQVCRDWLEFLGKKAEKPLELIAKTDVICFRDRMVAQGLAPRTVNQTVKLLRCIYQDAVDQGHIGRNPFVGVDALRADDADVARQPFTVDEVRALIDAADGDWKGLITLAATTGLRLMDASRIQWRHLDLLSGVIRIKTSKTGAVLSLPIHSAFAAWLADRTRGIAAAPVFPSLAEKAGTGKSGLSMAFKRLMARATVVSEVGRFAAKDGRGRTVSRKSFHSLRHFAAAQLASSGVRHEIARAITGHADPETHAHYVTADMTDLRAAVSKIKLSA